MSCLINRGPLILLCDLDSLMGLILLGLYKVLTYVPLIGVDYKVIYTSHTMLFWVFGDGSDHSGRLHAFEACRGHAGCFRAFEAGWGHTWSTMCLLRRKWINSPEVVFWPDMVIRDAS